MIAEGFHNAVATGPGEWAKTQNGMLLSVPVTVNGEKCVAAAFIGDDPEKAQRTREALKSWGWNAAASWPAAGTPLRVSVKHKVRNGQTEASIFIVSKGGGGQAVTGTDLEKFLAQERAALSGQPDPNDPFA